MRPVVSGHNILLYGVSHFALRRAQQCESYSVENEGHKAERTKLP